MTNDAKSLSDEEIATRLRTAWAQVKADAITLGRKGYRTHVSLLDYKTWCRFELSHFQTMGETVRIVRSKTQVTEL